MSEVEGAHIADVAPDSPAQKAGIKIGDNEQKFVYLIVRRNARSKRRQT